LLNCPRMLNCLQNMIHLITRTNLVSISLNFFFWRAFSLLNQLHRWKPDTWFFAQRMCTTFFASEILRYGQYLTHAHSHITRAVAAMDSCFVLVKTHQHGIAPGRELNKIQRTAATTFTMWSCRLKELVLCTRLGSKRQMVYYAPTDLESTVEPYKTRPPMQYRRTLIRRGTNARTSNLFHSNSLILKENP